MADIKHSTNATNLAEILERVLDKGLVIVGDIKVSLAEVDLLTIRLRLLVASVDKAKEIGINWWETDPHLSSRARMQQLERDSQSEQELESAVEEFNKLLAT
ncbi:MAG: gas vesicle protein [Desulforudis sp.]|nr:MAG: gas vesicle protein [Desulforudis sp.]